MSVIEAKKTSRPEKILIAMHKLCDGQAKDLKYEDIVVAAWEMFPEDFSLRGYKLPDASDIHKPLYSSLKQQGLVMAADKKFRLTPEGMRRAETLVGASMPSSERPSAKAGKASTSDPSRMDREAEKEIARLMKTDAYVLFSQGKLEEVLDTDFYSYLQTTVNSNKGQFIGRVNYVGAVIDRAMKFRADDEMRKLVELHAALLKKFKPVIDFMGAPSR